MRWLFGRDTAGHRVPLSGTPQAPPQIMVAGRQGGVGPELGRDTAVAAYRWALCTYTPPGPALRWTPANQGEATLPLYGPISLFRTSLLSFLPCSETRGRAHSPSPRVKGMSATPPPHHPRHLVSCPTYTFSFPLPSSPFPIFFPSYLLPITCIQLSSSSGMSLKATQIKYITFSIAHHGTEFVNTVFMRC